MKRRPLLFLCLSFSLFGNAAAAATQAAALKAYLERAVVSCPASKLDVTQIPEAGPAGFVAYKVVQTSTDPRCGVQKFALVSPASGQIVLGDVIALDNPKLTPEAEITEFATRMLRKPAVVRIDQTPLQDGVRRLRISTTTPHGPFSMSGYLDSSRRFMMIGRRGNINAPPGTTLLQSIGAAGAAYRGNRQGKIRILEISDFQCPTCKRAHDKFEKLISSNLSNISYTRLDLPLFEHHEWALQAAMGARAIQKLAPQKYWAYVDYMFENQEKITKANVDGEVRDFAAMHDLDWKKIEPLYRSPKERAILLDQVGKMFDEGVASTPTFIINGQPAYYGKDGEPLMKRLTALLAKK